MVAKKFRLPIQDFIRKRGELRRSPVFNLKIFNPTEDFSRLGVVISKKVFAKAVHRNKMKRIIFDFFQRNAARLPVNDYLVIVSPAATRLSKKEISEELNKLLNP